MTIKKDLTYDKYTLQDTYSYGKTDRSFQWKRIDSLLTELDSFQYQHITLATIRNYKNKNGVAPLISPNIQGKYNNLTDTFGVERYQSVPLYTTDSIPQLRRYGRDGALAAISGDSGMYYKLTFMSISGEWLVPKKYVHIIGPVFFRKAVFVDRKNQNIATLEQKDSAWYVRSMNPATTGLNRPPFQKPTPKGIFVIQEQKNKMV
ncbi:MAG: murein L,D-transpeptidase, partial [Bacteroidales bacterium]